MSLASAPSIPTIRDWYCPACGLTDRTDDPRAMNRYHRCPAVGGMAVPLQLAGVKAKVEAHEREDYVGTDDVQKDADGRPIMSVTITRDTGQDTVVYAPTARLRAKEM